MYRPITTARLHHFPSTGLPHFPSTKCQSLGREEQGKADVVVVGSGIIGISICNALLKRTGGGLRVALYEKHAVPCYGATGAGQGYVWLAHRNVGSPAWDLAVWSKQLWRDLLTEGLSASLEWQDSGSILLGQNEGEAQDLAERASLLQSAGLSAELLDSEALKDAEPGLAVSAAMSGLFLGSDAQINGRLAASALLMQCHAFGDSFQFHESEGVEKLLRTAAGGVVGVQTDKGHRIQASRGVVVAAGAWTGHLLADSLGEEHLREAFVPRKGHLLEISSPAGMPPLRHGLMELGYTHHYRTGQSTEDSKDAAITFTATASASGSLLIGSSREIAGFDGAKSARVEHAILQRASQFLPHLASVLPEDSQTRVGLRPYFPGGPAIGALPGCEGLFIAGGHEGSGLTLAPATAEIIARCLLRDLAAPDFVANVSPEALLLHLNHP